MSTDDDFVDVVVFSSYNAPFFMLMLMLFTLRALKLVTYNFVMKSLSSLSIRDNKPLQLGDKSSQFQLGSPLQPKATILNLLILPYLYVCVCCITKLLISLIILLEICLRCSNVIIWYFCQICSSYQPSLGQSNKFFATIIYKTRKIVSSYKSN